MSRYRWVYAFVALFLVGGCGTKALPPDVIQAGQLDIQLPPGWKVVHGVAVAPSQPDAGGSQADSDDAATTTIPLNKEDPTTEFFQATAAFSACLKGLGVTFIGAPSASDPSSPANDPNYLKALETCAAQSHIEQALKDFQTAQDNLTTKQIQQENQSYLKWRTCMIGRGWNIPTPVPDSKGRLFSLGSGSTLTPPAGESVLNSPDIQDCVQESQLNSISGG